SDGVLAIAITLLVLEISVPESDFDHLWRGIANQWPSYLAYATSFLTIGGIWLYHHAIFRRLAYADSNIIRLNLGLLMTVSFLPFPTKLMAESLHAHNGEHAAVLFYGACLLVNASLLAALGRYSAREGLIPDETDRANVRRAADAISPNLGFYGVIILAAAFIPRAAVYGFLVLAIRAILGTR
ncbi:MAG TPA: TMEM175 family protein, partial [Candidatus Dormibacteraeota bacterium]|nr:TMEM175 family protein [Candidatus Dormibacteraeota bacterium]